MSILELWIGLGLGVIGLFVVVWGLWRVWGWLCDLVERMDEVD
jgi:hypothetical protein